MSGKYLDNGSASVRLATAKGPAKNRSVATVRRAKFHTQPAVDVVLLTKPERLFVISHQKPKALLTNRGQYLHELLKASVGKVIETWEKVGVQAFQVEALVGDVDALRVISHAYPKYVVRAHDFGDGFPKCIHIAGPRSKVNVSDGY